MLTGCLSMRLRVAEDLHPVDELSDAVCLLADQLSQGSVRGACVLLYELRRSADAGQGIL